MISKTIKDFPNYLITDSGRVWNDKYKRWLIPIKQPHGYLTVTLGGISKRYIHRLVLEAFIGKCPKGMQCCHNNGNKADNRLENLRWDTRSNNNKDKIKHGKTKGMFVKGIGYTGKRIKRAGVNSPNAKLTEQDVLIIRNVYNKEINGYRLWNQTQLAKKFNIHPSTISRILNNKSWTCFIDKPEEEF